MNNFILGTAQLKNSYGLLNKKSKNKKEVFQFLEFAINKGINYFDTAPGYNNQNLLGEFFKLNRFSLKPKLISKIPSLSKIPESKKIDFIKKSINKTANELHISPQIIFFHDPKDNFFLFKNFSIIKEIINDNGINNIGSSVYKKVDLQYLKNLNNISFQFPLSVANQEFKNYPFKKDSLLIARSIFLQGALINLNLKKVPNLLENSYKKYVNYINKNKIDALAMSINFILQQKINNFIIGIDNKDQLEKIIDHKYKKFSMKIEIEINQLFLKKSLDPRKW